MSDAWIIVLALAAGIIIGRAIERARWKRITAERDAASSAVAGAADQFTADIAKITKR